MLLNCLLNKDIKMKWFLFIICVICLISCKKQNANEIRIIGVFVEESLRLDTMDFDVNARIDGLGYYFDFLSAPFVDSLYPFLIMNASFYECIIGSSTIQLKSAVQSTNMFQSIPFNLAEDKKSFTINKFYIRSRLPNSLKFVRL